MSSSRLPSWKVPGLHSGGHTTPDPLYFLFFLQSCQWLFVSPRGRRRSQKEAWCFLDGFWRKMVVYKADLSSWHFLCWHCGGVLSIFSAGSLKSLFWCGSICHLQSSCLLPSLPLSESLLIYLPYTHPGSLGKNISLLLSDSVLLPHMLHPAPYPSNPAVKGNLLSSRQPEVKAVQPHTCPTAWS